MVLRIGEKMELGQRIRLHEFLELWRKKYRKYSIASGQTYELLGDLCQSATGTVIDLGSGFSSFVIREFCNDRYKCVSVDTTRWCLNNASNFCSEYFMGDHNGDFILWKEFMDRVYMDASLIFFDIGYTSNRSVYFRPVFDKYLKNGVKILIDDVHKPAVLANLQFVLNKYDYKYDKINVKDETLDQWGRFCWLIEGKE